MTPPLAKLLTAALGAGLCLPQVAAASPVASAVPAAAMGPAAMPMTPVQPQPSSAPTELPDSITLPEVFDLLKSRSPRYKAYEADIDVAKSEVVAARVLPNPTINLSILYLNVGFNQNGVATYYANATLPLLIAGQRRSRVKTADYGVRSAEADLKASYHEMAYEARELFVELQADQARIKVLDEALADLARLEQIIAARKQSGVETDYDTLRINVETSTWKARRAEEEASAQDTAGRLGVLLGIPSWYPEAEGELHQMGLRGDADQMWPEIEKSQPRIVAATRYEAYANKNIDLTKRERWPVPSITAGTVAIQNYYSISTQVGITVPIPMFDWGQGMLAQATSRSQRARREREAVVASTQAELKRALRLLDHRRRALDTFEQDVLSKIPTMKQMAEDSFRAGQTQLIELLDATRARFEVKLTNVDMLEAVVQAEVDVLGVTGRIEETSGR
ncbi:TolC family protein [Nannocystis radixulma]|uniref:TolC family protein n=1 Tax=Nannocystis radixulma TaxID=2995305 RepID=A0ABT5B5I8_9BACT|nr:TolC family protein [Nannocystis radixulma]MDC0669394.1 TolC family protein [Nannocystis radixulma]